MQFAEKFAIIREKCGWKIAHGMSSDTKKIWLIAAGYWVVMMGLCVLCYPVTIPGRSCIGMGLGFIV